MSSVSWWHIVTPCFVAVLVSACRTYALCILIELYLFGESFDLLSASNIGSNNARLGNCEKGKSNHAKAALKKDHIYGCGQRCRICKYQCWQNKGGKTRLRNKISRVA